jgi:hypothetical protein
MVRPNGFAYGCDRTLGKRLEGGMLPWREVLDRKLQYSFSAKLVSHGSGMSSHSSET